MKVIQRYILFLFLISSSVLSAGTLWSGNAVRGTEDDFNTYYSSAGTLLGASRALPIGTVIEVTNQLKEEKVTVIIVGENSRTGVFLLLSPEAASEISLEKGEMILVQVQEKPGTGNTLFEQYQNDRDAYLEENSYDEPLDSIDPDNNLFARGEEELNALNQNALDENTLDENEDQLEPIEEPMPPEEPIDEPIEEIIPEEPIEDITPEEPIEEPLEDPLEDILPIEPVDEPLDEILPEEPVDNQNFDQVVIGGFGSRDIIPLVEPAGEEVGEEDDWFKTGDELDKEKPEDLIDEPIEEPIEEPVEPIEEPVEPIEEPVEEPVEEPIEEPVEPIEEPIEPIEEPIEESTLVIEERPVVDRVIYFLTPAPLKPPEYVQVEEDNGEESTVVLIPQEVTNDELKGLMETPLEQGRRYIQVAAFSAENMEQIFQKMAELETYFPMVLLEPDDNHDTYRLLVGPAARDEMGVLLKYHLPAQGFNDAMEFKQD